MSVCSDDKRVVEFYDRRFHQIQREPTIVQNHSTHITTSNFTVVTQQYTYLLTILLSFKLQRTLR